MSADASGELDELSADDILEENDIDALEAAASGFRGFAPPSSPSVSSPSSSSSPARAPAPAPSEPGDFEVSDIGAFDDVEVEGMKPEAHAAEIEAAPVSMKVDYAAPSPSTLMGFPAAPITSPLPLESMIVDDAFPEKTLEIPTHDVKRAAAVAATLDADAHEIDPNAPQHTEVLVRSAMPAALQAPRLPRITPMLTPLEGAPTRPVTAQLSGRPGSIAPVAMDASIPPAHMIARAPVKTPPSSLALGGVVFALVAIVGFLGVGAYVATRAIADKADSVAVSSPPSSPQEKSPAAAAAEATPATPAFPDTTVVAPAAPVIAAPEELAAAPVAAPVADSPQPAAAFDVSSLPSAPVAVAAAPAVAAPASPASPRAIAPKTVTGSAPAEKATTTSRSGAALPPPGAVPAAPSAGGAPAARSGAPSSGTAAPLAAPVAPAAAAAAPAAPVATTGTVRVDPKLRAVVVDGSYRRVDGGNVTVSCGPHRIKAGMDDVKSVNVPCGGSTSL